MPEADVEGAWEPVPLTQQMEDRFSASCPRCLSPTVFPGSPHNSLLQASRPAFCRGCFAEAVQTAAWTTEGATPHPPLVSRAAAAAAEPVGQSRPAKSPSIISQAKAHGQGPGSASLPRENPARSAQLHELEVKLEITSFAARRPL